MAGEEVGNLAVKISMDSTGFATGVAGINREIKVVQSEFKAASAALGGFGTSTEQLGLKAGNLTKQIDLQRTKVQTLEKAFQDSAKNKGLDAKATQDLQIKLNNAKAAMSGMETELGRTNQALAESTTKQEKLATATETTEKKTSGLKTAFGAVGLAAGAYLVGAVKSAEGAEASTARLTGLLKNQGISADDVGKDIKQFTGAITKMSSFSAGEAKEALQTLTEKGIDASKALGMEGTIADVAAGQNSSLSEAAGLVADAYHGKAKALVSLGVLTKEEAKSVGDSEDAAISMTEVQKRLNAQFGGSANAQLGTYSGQMKMMENQMNSAKASIGLAMLPILSKLAVAISEIIIPMAAWIKENPKLTAGILAIFAALGTLVGGASIIGTMAAAFGPLSAVFSGIGISIGAVMWPVLAVIAGVALLGLAYKTNFGGMKVAVDSFVKGSMKFLMDIFNEVKTWVITNLPMIKATFKVIFDQIVIVLQAVFNYLSSIFLPVFIKVHDWVVLNLPTIKATFAEVFNNVVAVAKVLWNYFQVNILPIIMRLVDTIKAQLPTIQRIFQTVFSIIGNVLDIAWSVIKKVWDIMVSLYNFVSPTFPAIGAIIKTAFDIVIGVVESVIGTFVKLVDWITKAVNWLTNWNDTPAKNKNATMTTTNISSDGSLPSHGIPK